MTKPHPVDILNDSREILFRLGNPAQAGQSNCPAMLSNPAYADAYISLGQALGSSGRFPEAEEAFRKAAELWPGCAEAVIYYGNILMVLEQFEKAERIYRQAIVIKPDLAVAYFHRGNALRALDRLAVAEKCYRQSIDLMPAYAEAFSALAQILRASGRTEEAEQCYCQAVAFAADPEDISFESGTPLSDIYRQALQSKPVAERYLGLGNAFLQLEQVEAAVQVFHQALSFKPDYAEALCWLGYTYFQLNRMDAAEEPYRHALTIRPDFVEACNGLGHVLICTARLAEAEQLYRQITALSPDYLAGKINLALVLLLQGKFAEGLSLYELRIDNLANTPSGQVMDKCKALPGCKRWEQEDLTGQSLLVVTEQGAGDSIMMLRYFALLKERGLKKLVVSCEPHLERLLRAMPEVDELISQDDPLPDGLFSLYCPIMSLPFQFKTSLDTIPDNIPCLHIEGFQDSSWLADLRSTAGFKVGLVWGGNKEYPWDSTRSIPLYKFAPLTEIDGVRLVSLQKGEYAGQLAELGWNIIDVMDRCNDFLDTAVLIDTLDLVISVDTAVAHLAGTMGKPVWLLNRYESEWRWLMDRTDSPWYPGMRIFRQAERMDWDTLIKQVAEELDVMVMTP